MGESKNTGPGLHFDGHLRLRSGTLATRENVDALASVNGSRVEKAISRTETKKVILDMDSSESPFRGNQEGAAYNGHFRSTFRAPSDQTGGQASRDRLASGLKDPAGGRQRIRSGNP